MEHDRSNLRRALRRVGGNMTEVTDVDGVFVAPSLVPEGDRVYGTLQAPDSSITLGFDRKLVPLPSHNNVPMRVSGRVWLDDRNGSVTIMVRNYAMLPEANT